MIQCCLIKCNQGLLKSSGEMIFIDDKKFLGIRDTCSHITICHPGIIPKENMLEHGVINLKDIGLDSVVLLMARVALNYHGWFGILKVVVSDQIPAPSDWFRFI